MIDQIQTILAHHLADQEVETEWQSFRGEAGIYSPRLDLAVGPFATGNDLLEESYNTLVRDNRPLLDWLADCHDRNLVNAGYARWANGRDVTDRIQNANRNSRCLVAVEVENTTSEKHIIGGIFNATSLGRIAILGARNVDTLNSMLRMLRYLSFVQDRKRVLLHLDNLFVLSTAQVEAKIRDGL